MRRSTIDHPSSTTFRRAPGAGAPRASGYHSLVGALALTGLAGVWAGCAEADSPGGSPPTGGGGAGGAAAGGDTGVGAFQSSGGAGGSTTCVATSKKAEPTPLDIILLLDWSESMQGASWSGTTTALQSFFNDPLSAGINAGLVFSPTIKPGGPDNPCDPAFYKTLDVPIASLPGNAFNLTNAMPADAVGYATPMYGSLSGALMAATAYQDAHPTHKVVVVMTGDGDYNTCGENINSIAAWAKSALDYNGVRTYVIAVESASFVFGNLEQVAEQGGTGQVYDAQDIDDFAAKMAEIRQAALGCDFEIPPPPAEEMLVPNEVNFTYTPGGTGTPITLPRADNLGDCGDQPGWYYDNNQSPTKIIVCPASCATIQNDSMAEVAVAFGCASIVN